MLQQTQVATVIPYYKRWLDRFPDFASLARATDSDVLHAWQGLGYYARARNLHAAAKTSRRAARGSFPKDVDRIRALPGLGRYTANAVATFAFDQSVPVVEANIARLLARLLDLQTPIDSSGGSRANLGLRFRSCSETRRCHLQFSADGSRRARLQSASATMSHLSCAKFCRATDPASLPLKKPRPQTIELEEHHVSLFKTGRVLLEQSRARWRGMWILPPLDSPNATRPALHRSQFPFTHHRVSLSVFAQAAPTDLQSNAALVSSLTLLASIPLPSPHRRALHAIMEQHLVPPTDFA